MPKLDPKTPGSFKELEALIARIAPTWKTHPNVVAIVPALKTKGGFVHSETLVLGFYVREKVSPEVLKDRGYTPIPPEIEGVPTDVIPAIRKPLGSVDEKATRSQMFDTLAGGIAVGNANMNVYGTLAMILFAQSDSRPVGLTNEHVLVFDTDGHVGDEVQQPRFYLNSEVSIDSAACCPNGQLHYRGVDNPIVDASAAVFAAAALAAVLSDEIDPHRRGQIATVPHSNERTIRETVSVELEYPEIPFPGRPYKVDAKWKYRRETDQRTMEHAVSETKRNTHTVETQELITDRAVYPRGDRVIFIALLSPEPHQKVCHNYFVTAAALSSSHRRAYRIILKPWDANAAVANHQAAAAVNDKVVRHCVSFTHQKPNTSFKQPRIIEGMTFDPEGFSAVFVPAVAPQPPKLRFPDHGLTVRFQGAVQEVRVRVELHAGKAVKLTAFNGSAEVSADSTTGASPAVLSVAAGRITHVVLSGGSNEAQLVEICIGRKLGRFCVYRGEMPLAPDEELGIWTTYLFAQTRNDVPVGTDPLVAATIIGGLPVTNNYADGGESDNITYGHSCLVDIVPNGQFEVVMPKPDNEIG